MEGQAEGVTQDTSAPETSVQDSAPESVVNNDAGTSENSEAPKSKEYNFKQLREKLGKLEAERQAWTEREKTLQQAATLDRALREDPKGTLKIIAKQLGVNPQDLMDQIAEAEKPQAPNFEQYDAETGKLLKALWEKANKVDELQQWKDEFSKTQEQREVEAREKSIETNMNSLDSFLEESLIKDGFLGKNGEGDHELMQDIADMMLAKLAKHGDPRLATKEQFLSEYNAVIKRFKTLQANTLNKTVTKSVPPTGSRQGAPTVGTPAIDKGQRLGMLADMFKQSFGNG